jgi:hypothetical protein
VAFRLLNVRDNISSDLAYFTNCLEVNLELTKTSIISQAENETLKHQTALTSYDWLLRMRISEHCNDASLNLGEIWLQQESMHPDDMSQKDKSAISGAVTACVQFLIDIVLSIQSKTLVPLNRTREARGLYIQKDMTSLLSRHFHHGNPGHSEFARIVPDFLKALNSSFEPAPGQKYEACLGEVSKLFLEFAVRIEKLLGQPTAEGKGKGSSKMTGTDEAIMELTEGMKTVAITKVSILSTIGVAEPLPKSITSELDNADESFFDMIEKMNMDDDGEKEGEEEDE